jgi:hypothetical protein
VAVALNCSVAPVPMVAVTGDAETEASVFDEDEGRPWHPVFASINEREKQETETESNQR